MPDEIRQNRTPTTLSPESIPPSFTPAQTLAMAALLSGKSKTAAAQAAGVSRSTIHDWLANDPDFLAFYNSCRLEMIETIQQSMLLLSGSAVKALGLLLRRRKTPDMVKVRAASEVLKHSARAVEGPTNVEEAENAIAIRVKGKSQTRMRAKLGLQARDPEHRVILDRLEARDDKAQSRH
jgi:phage terminase small subunit